MKIGFFGNYLFMISSCGERILLSGSPLQHPSTSRSILQFLSFLGRIWNHPRWFTSNPLPTCLFYKSLIFTRKVLTEVSLCTLFSSLNWPPFCISIFQKLKLPCFFPGPTLPLFSSSSLELELFNSSLNYTFICSSPLWMYLLCSHPMLRLSYL